MTAEAHIDQAILDLQRAAASARHDSQFALHCLADARFSIAAARVAIVAPPVPVKKRSDRTQKTEGVAAA